MALGREYTSELSMGKRAQGGGQGSLPLSAGAGFQRTAAGPLHCPEPPVATVPWHLQGSLEGAGLLSCGSQA